MFNPPNGINSKLKGADVVEQAKMLNVGYINRASATPTANFSSIGVSTNDAEFISEIVGASKTNDYLINQKLRNMGLYTKLKNKTIYSAGSLAHADLVKGIL